MMILVTGADGFIGSHLVEALVEQGENVRAFVLYNSFGKWGWLDTLPESTKNKIDVFMGDVRDPYGVKQAMLGCNTIFHLAALIGIPYSYHSPDTYIDTNVKGTLNIVQAARELGVQRVIHTSTSEVYGTARYVPIDEAHPLQGQSPYSASKIGADQIAMSFYTSFDVPVTTVRPFNTFGPRQSTRAFIPTVITQIASGKEDIKLGSLTPTRDFTYVEDTVSGFIAAANSHEVIGDVINLGSNFEISMEDTVNTIASVMGAEIFVSQDMARIRPEKSEVERLWADNHKALKLTDWQPKYPGREGFELGLAKTVNWFCQEHNLARYKAEVYQV